MRIEHFTAPCSICGKPMHFTSENSKWWNEKVEPVLERAFAKWFHVECKERRETKAIL
ncbi:MAG: hypothetical protein QXF29_06090 [Archaeoglobaceae archaeon]